MTTPFDLPTPELERSLLHSRQHGPTHQHADSLIALLVRLIDYDTERASVLLDELHTVASTNAVGDALLYEALIRLLLDWENGERDPVYEKLDALLLQLRQTANARLLGWAIYVKCVFEFYRGNIGTTLLLTLEAQEIFEQLGDLFGLANVCGMVAGCYRALGETTRQLSANLLAWRCLRVFETPAIEIISLHNIVLSYLQEERIAEALEYITLALRQLEQYEHLFTPIMHNSMQCRFLVFQAAVYLQQGDGAAARATIETATTVFDNRPTTRPRGRVWVGLTGVLSDIEFADGHYAVAEAAALESLAACEEAYNDNYAEQIRCHRRLVAIYQRTGNFEAAFRHSEQGYQLERKNTTQILAMEQIEERLQRAESGFSVEKETAFLQSLLDEVLQRQAEHRRQQQTDVLTRVYNRRYLDDTLPGLVENARRTQTPLSIAFCDIDNFKQINDTFLHTTGDAVLKILGQLLPTVYKEPCAVVRQGGEEFVVIAPGIDATTMATHAEQVRQAISAFAWESIAPRLRVTLSIGVAEVEDGETAEQLLDRADAAMYRAKRSGKNRVMIATEADRLREVG